jgi:hypothetical protein
VAERRWSNEELEAALRTLPRDGLFPPTPDLATTVRGRLERAGEEAAPPEAAPSPYPLPEGEERHSRHRVATRRWRRGLLALAALLALALLVLAGSPATRRAVAERLGLRSVSIEHVPELPPTPTPAASPRAGAPGASLGLGDPVPLETALGISSFRVAVPSLPEYAQPDAVYVTSGPAGAIVTLVYASRPGLPAGTVPDVGLLLTYVRGEVAPEFVGKMLGPGTTATELRIGGARALWIEGQPHTMLYRDASGAVRSDTLRLAGNVLLWERTGVLGRIESALSRDQVVQIAESVR